MEEENAELAPPDHRVVGENALRAGLRTRDVENDERAVLETSLPLRKERLRILTHLELHVDRVARGERRAGDREIFPHRHTVAEVLDLVVHLDHGVVPGMTRLLAEGQHRGGLGRRQRVHRDPVPMAQEGELRGVADRVGEGQQEISPLLRTPLTRRRGDRHDALHELRREDVLAGLDESLLEIRVNTELHLVLRVVERSLHQHVLDSRLVGQLAQHARGGVDQPIDLAEVHVRVLLAEELAGLQRLLEAPHHLLAGRRRGGDRDDSFRRLRDGFLTDAFHCQSSGCPAWKLYVLG